MKTRIRTAVVAVAIGALAWTAPSAQAAPSEPVRHDAAGSLWICVGPPLVFPIPGPPGNVTIALCF